jgi:hypothetical protein
MSPTGRAAGTSGAARRATLGLVAILLAGVLAGGFTAARASASEPPVGQALIILLHNKVVRSAPLVGATRTAVVSAHRPLTGVRTVLPVLGRHTELFGPTWIEVRLPGRPNSSVGWITAADTLPSWTPWRLSVDLATRVLTVWNRGRVVRRFRAVIGKPSTPTPTGRFFIEEGLSLSATASGAPFALASSARSSVLQDFDGGPGQIAIHGRGGLVGALGTASSHGCIRLNTPDVTWLALRIGAGVPLNIRPFGD